VRYYDFKGLERTQEIVVITHQAEAMKQRFYDESHLSEMNDMLTLQR